MVRAAIDLKMTRLGFSVHSYTDFDESFCAKKERIADYKAEIRDLAQKYKDKLQILCGVEQEYFSDEPTDGFDYVIGSVHYVKKSGEFFDVDNTPEIFVNGVNEFIEEIITNVIHTFFNIYRFNICSIIM